MASSTIRALLSGSYNLGFVLRSRFLCNSQLKLRPDVLCLLPYGQEASDGRLHCKTHALGVGFRVI